MGKAPTVTLSLVILLLVQGAAVESVLAGGGESLVIGRITGTNLGYPTMFRNADDSLMIPDPMVVRWFVLLGRDGRRVRNVYLKPDGFFFAKVPPGPLTLARRRKDRPYSREPAYHEILSFDAIAGRIINLGTIGVRQEGAPVQTGFSFGVFFTVGKYTYNYRYERVGDHEPVLEILIQRKPALYESFAGSPPITINAPSAVTVDSSKKEFKLLEDRDRP